MNRIDEYISGIKEELSREALNSFTRFPKWMWRNSVVQEFIEWAKSYNRKFDNDYAKKVSLYLL